MPEPTPPLDAVHVELGDPRYCQLPVRHDPHTYRYEVDTADPLVRRTGRYECSGEPWPAPVRYDAKRLGRDQLGAVLTNLATRVFAGDALSASICCQTTGDGAYVAAGVARVAIDGNPQIWVLGSPAPAMHPRSRACPACLAANPEQFQEFPTNCPHVSEDAPVPTFAVDDGATTHHERAVALAAVLAPHRLKRVHKDRDDIYRARCLCDWPGSPWERREGAVAEHERHVAAEVLAAQEGLAAR